MPGRSPPKIGSAPAKMSATASLRRLPKRRAATTWPLFSTTTKKDCLIMETRIPNFPVTYNCFSVEHSQKNSQREKSGEHKRETERRTVCRFTGIWARAGDVTSLLRQFPRFQWKSDHY